MDIPVILCHTGNGVLAPSASGVLAFRFRRHLPLQASSPEVNTLLAGICAKDTPMEPSARGGLYRQFKGIVGIIHSPDTSG